MRILQPGARSWPHSMGCIMMKRRPSLAIPTSRLTTSQQPRNANTNIEVGLFCDDRYAEVSAVVYSSLATWGKLRAVAENPNALSVYCTLHPNPGSLHPIMRSAMKQDYSEHLMDGLYVLHNPFARHPLPPGLLSHPRLCEVNVAPDGELIMNAPDDFLLLRMLNTVKLTDAPEQA